jgi:IS4 transposase
VSPLPGLVDGFFRRFEVLDRPPFREEAVRESLRRLGASGARVRTRGESADADRWTKAVRTGVDSGLELDLFLLRLGDHRLALVVRDLR